MILMTRVFTSAKTFYGQKVDNVVTLKSNTSFQILKRLECSFLSGTVMVFLYHKITILFLILNSCLKSIVSQRNIDDYHGLKWCTCEVSEKVSKCLKATSWGNAKCDLFCGLSHWLAYFNNYFKKFWQDVTPWYWICHYWK